MLSALRHDHNVGQQAEPTTVTELEVGEAKHCLNMDQMSGCYFFSFFNNGGFSERTLN